MLAQFYRTFLGVTGMPSLFLDSAEISVPSAASPEEPTPTSVGPAPVVTLTAPADGEEVAGTGDPSAMSPVQFLVARARAGDQEAFARLYDRYVDLIYRYIFYRVGTVALAEDLTSETFLRALRRLGTFTWQGKDFGAWLVTIARNLIADHFKSGRYRLEISTADMVDADRPEAGPEAAVLDSITAASLLRAVRELGPDQQECLMLRFLHGLSIAETALAMDRTEGAVKALQYRAVRALARLIPADFR